MKKIMLVWLMLYLLILQSIGCSSIETRSYYIEEEAPYGLDDLNITDPNGKTLKTKANWAIISEIPYYPTYRSIYSQVDEKYPSLFFWSFGLGVIYIIPDIVFSTVFDTLLLPFDIYRNNITIRRRVNAINERASKDSILRKSYNYRMMVCIQNNYDECPSPTN